MLLYAKYDVTKTKTKRIFELNFLYNSLYRQKAKEDEAKKRLAKFMVFNVVIGRMLAHL